MFKFNLSNDGKAYEVSAASKDISGEVHIPAIYEGKPVAAIARYGFSSCKNITNIFIPDSVERIDNTAFQECSIKKRELDICYADKWLIKSCMCDRPKVRQDLIIKEGTVGIADYCIFGTYASVVIPASLKYI